MTLRTVPVLSTPVIDNVKAASFAAARKVTELISRCRAYANIL